jgi:hypothetical protein
MVRDVSDGLLTVISPHHHRPPRIEAKMRKIKKKRPKLRGKLITEIFTVSSKDPL